MTPAELMRNVDKIAEEIGRDLSPEDRERLTRIVKAWLGLSGTTPAKRSRRKA